jgi:type I restriction enzyme S subunit
MSWEYVDLVSVCDFQGGTQPPKSEWSDKKNEGFVRMIQIRDFTQGKDSFIEYVKDNKSLKKCNADDIMIGRYGASIGKILTGIEGAYNVALVKTILSNELDKRYFFHYLKAPYFQNFIQNAGSRAAQAGFNKEELKELQIPLPPLATQKRIAEILDAADALRRKDQELLKKYDELAQAIFIDMFGDPVKNEKGWEVRNLKVVTTKIGSGATPTGGKMAYKETGISLIRSMNVYDFSFKWKDLAHIDEAQAARLNNVAVESKDVLFNITGASVCRCSIVPDELLPARVNQHVAIVRANNKLLNPIFLNHLLVADSVKKKLLAVGSGGGAVMEAITKDQLEQFEIIVPPIELQNQFEFLIQNVFKQKDKGKNINKETNDMFHSLIQRAFKGELVI